MRRLNLLMLALFCIAACSPTKTRRNLPPRIKLHRLLAMPVHPFTKVVKKSSLRIPGGVEEIYRFHDRDGTVLTAALFRPVPSPPRAPLILALTGHHSSWKAILGRIPAVFGENFGKPLLAGGAMVLAPEIRAIAPANKEDHQALKYILKGSSLMAHRVWDLIRMKAFFLHRFPNQRPVGVVGWSAGALAGAFLAALDNRIDFLYCSCYFGSFADSIVKRRLTTDNYVPAILKFGELVDIYRLIAPRPLYIEVATRDREFPLPIAQKAYISLRRTYQKLGAVKKLRWKAYPGSHRFYGHELLKWLKSIKALP